MGERNMWGRSNDGGGILTPAGVGGGPNQAQMELFQQAAQDSGLTSMGMQMVDQATDGMRNEDQVSLLYHLMATHPNEVSLFFLHYPEFMTEFASLIALIVKKEMFAFFDAGIVTTAPERGGPLAVDAAAATDYSSITQENLDAQIAKVVPLQNMQMEVNQKDMAAMQMINTGQMQQQQHDWQQQQQQQQQQQWQQNQQWQQQPQQPQQQGVFSAIGSFGGSVIRSTLNLPPAAHQAQPGMVQPGVPPQGYQGGY